MEALLEEEVLRLYQEVADHPDGGYHFFHGRVAAERFGYAPGALDRAPAGAADSFAGVVKPGGRVSFTDIVSARALSQGIVNDPKLWAS